MRRLDGYDQLEASSGGSPSMKNQVVGFLVAVQYLRSTLSSHYTYRRLIVCVVPLVVINIVAIFLELLMG